MQCPGAQIPATGSTITDAGRWADRIMLETDRRHPCERQLAEGPANSAKRANGAKQG